MHRGCVIGTPGADDLTGSDVAHVPRVHEPAGAPRSDAAVDVEATLRSSGDLVGSTTPRVPVATYPVRIHLGSGPPDAPGGLVRQRRRDLVDIVLLPRGIDAWAQAATAVEESVHVHRAGPETLVRDQIASEPRDRYRSVIVPAGVAILGTEQSGLAAASDRFAIVVVVGSLSIKSHADDIVAGPADAIRDATDIHYRIIRLWVGGREPLIRTMPSFSKHFFGFTPPFQKTRCTVIDVSS